MAAKKETQIGGDGNASYSDKYNCFYARTLKHNMKISRKDHH